MIFSILWILVIFYTIKPQWVGDFATVIKNSKLFRFLHDFEVFPRENSELVHAEPGLNNFFLRARSKIKKSYGCF